jgi:hypothetical protein
MKKLLSLILFLACIQLLAQDDKTSRPSPPAQATAKIGQTTITIDYSQPSVKGRRIFGELVPYGSVWRTGANETTTIEFSSDVTIDGKTVGKGRYGLFSIPGEKSWTIIINKGIKWGAFSYKQEEDVIRFTVPARKSKEFSERLKFDISKKGEITLRWETVEVSFLVK